MKASFKKTLADIEKRLVAFSVDVPVLIMIYYRSDIEKWIVQSTYKTGTGQTGYRQTVEQYASMDDYRLPDGFTGTCIVDDMAMTEDMESPAVKIEGKRKPDDYDLVHYYYAD